MQHTNKQEQLALILARQLMQELADPKKLAVASEHVRNQARAILQHYPTPSKLIMLYADLVKAKQNDVSK